MALVLFALSILIGLAGFGVLSQAASILQEMAGLMMFLASAVLLSGSFIVNSIDKSRRRICASLADIRAALARQQHFATAASDAGWPVVDDSSR